MARHASRLALAFLALGLFASSAIAQYSGGGLWGRGKAGDTIRIENTDTGVNREEKLAADGKYRFERIPVGTYVLTITHADGTMDLPVKVRVALGTNTYVPAADNAAADK
jgi:hypothetical protein